MKKNFSFLSFLNIKKDIKEWSLGTKIFYTILLLVIYRIGVYIPIPFTNTEVLQEALKNNSDSPFLQAFAMVGGSANSLGILTLGVSPYITASIVLSLMKNVIPRLKTMNETYEGQQKIQQWTRYLTIPLAILQSLGIVVSAPYLFGVNVYTHTGILPLIIGTSVMTVGALIAMRLGELITLKGITNGTSLIISTSILASLPGLFATSWVNNQFIGIIWLISILLIVISFVTYVENSEYRIPVLYPKTSFKPTTSKTSIPIKVAIAGVLPVIFSSSLLSIPLLLQNFFPSNNIIQKINIFLSYGNLPYTILYILLTIALTFFSLSMTFNTKELSERIKHQGGYIAGKRPGYNTEAFLTSLAYKMCFLDGIYLCLISMVTIQIFPLIGLTTGAFGATSIIILCTVTVTLLSALEAEKKMKNLNNFSLFS